MTPVAIKQDQWEAVNKKGARKPHASFATALAGAAAAAKSTTQPAVLHADAKPTLRRSDFAAGNDALPADTARQLKPLAPADFGGATPAPATLRPLDATDFVPGAKPVDDDAHKQIQTQAEKWVSQTFYGTLLRQMNDSPFKSDLFSGGRGGQAFAPMLSQQLADRMAHAGSNKLVRSLVRSIEKKTNHRNPAATAAEPRGATGAIPTPVTPSTINPYKDVRIHVAPNPGA